MSDFTIIRRSMTSRMFSTVTTAGMVAVSVGLMLVLVGMHDSGQKAFARGAGNMHLLVGPGGASPLTAVLDGIFYANAPRRPIPWSKYIEIREKFPLEYAVPTQQGDSYRGFPVLATTAEFFTKFKPDPDHGWAWREGNVFVREFEVVAGAEAAEGAGLHVGAKIHLSHGMGRNTPGGETEADEGEADGEEYHEGEHHGANEHLDYEYTVVGILEPTGGSHDRAVFTDLTSAWVIHAHDRRQREDTSVTSTGPEDLQDVDRKITGIYLRVMTRPGWDASAGAQQIFDQLRGDATVTVAHPEQEIRKLFVIVGDVDKILVGMAGVAMVSSGIGIMLALYNSMEQRRRQIAILRVLGCSRGRVFGLVVTESALLGLMGAAAGTAIGFAGLEVVAGLMRQRVGLVIEPTMGLEVVMVTTAAALALASAAGVVPAVMAYRTPVAKNLKPLG